jgi:hypothetical protein
VLGARPARRVKNTEGGTIHIIIPHGALTRDRVERHAKYGLHAARRPPAAPARARDVARRHAPYDSAAVRGEGDGEHRTHACRASSGRTRHAAACPAAHTLRTTARRPRSLASASAHVAAPRTSPQRREEEVTLRVSITSTSPLVPKTSCRSSRAGVADLVVVVVVVVAAAAAAAVVVVVVAVVAATQKGAAKEFAALHQVNRGTEEPRNRGTEEPRNRGTEEPRNRGTEEPRNRGTEEPRRESNSGACSSRPRSSH